MNNKSTENLIESGESIEELFAPSMNSEEKKYQTSEQSHSNRANTESDHPNDDNRKFSPKNFLVDKSSSNKLSSKSSNPPIPAVRKFSLPPIATERNGKDVKDNSNQSTRKQSIQENNNVEIVNERPSSQKPTKNDSESESDSNVRETNASSRERRNNIELTSFTKEAKKRLKKSIASSEVNEETTSFVSYEEKHEKEDNSEHLTSNHSSTKSLELPKKDLNGVKNEAFEPDCDDSIQMENIPKTDRMNDSANEDVVKTKSKKKGKISKSSRKQKETRKKRTKHKAESDTEQIEAAEAKENLQDVYDFKRVIGVWIHETSALRFDPLIRQPRVRVSFYNLNDGELLCKSNPLRNAVLNYEPTNVTFIQPILSNRCVFKDSSQIECDWNNELLIINEDIRHIQKFHVIIFFEVVDILNSNRNFESNASNGWYPICWAFLKPGDGKIFSNIDIQCSLQLHYYQRQRHKRGIIDEWKSQRRIKYPACLAVTVGAYQPDMTRSVSLSRPMSVLEEETTGDIYTCASDDDEAIVQQSQTPNSTSEQKQQQNFLETSSRIESKTLNIESRLPGQPCKYPNRLAYKYEMAGHLRSGGGRSQYGSMVAKFSLNGTYLAFHCTAYLRNNHEIIVVDVNNLQISHTLVGHLSIVYDLDWLSENVLASVSSDRTAIVWFLSENQFHMKVLPHPSFVYAAKWLSKHDEHAYIATGGRDCVLRIWKISKDVDADIELCDELIQHDNYITSLAASRKATKIYSADWNGVLLEWSLKKSDKGKHIGPLYQLKRKIKIFPKSIARIELHAKSNRMYVQCINDPLVYVIETTSAVVIQTINNNSNYKTTTRNTFTVSPCGSLLFTKCPNDDQIKCNRVSNEEAIGQFRIPISLASRKYSVTSLTFHPNKNLLAFTIFGDVISSCLFIMCSECDGMSKPLDDDMIRYEDNIRRNFPNLDDFRKIQNTVDGNQTITIDSILNRIDDLFFMAIRNTQQTENDQFNEMQQFLTKFRLETPQMITDANELTASNPNGISEVINKVEAYFNELSSASGESERIDTKNNGLFEKSNALRASWQLQSTTKSHDSHSNSSNHTFGIDETNEPNEESKRSDENEKSDATYSIETDTSKRSNLTFEVPSKMNN